MATTTITTSSADDARIAAAFGAYLNLGRNATLSEVKAALMAFVVNVVRSQEAAPAALTANPTPVVPT